MPGSSGHVGVDWQRIHLQEFTTDVEWYRCRGFLRESNYFFVRAEQDREVIHGLKVVWALEHQHDPFDAFTDLCHTMRARNPTYAADFLTGGNATPTLIDFTHGERDPEYLRSLIVGTFSSDSLGFQKLRDYGGATVSISGADTGWGSLARIVSRAGKQFLGED